MIPDNASGNGPKADGIGEKYVKWPGKRNGN
jgi:hypothetical protein